MFLSICHCSLHTVIILSNVSSTSTSFTGSTGDKCIALWLIKLLSKQLFGLPYLKNPSKSNPIQSTFVKRHQSSCLFRGASQKHRGKPLNDKCTGFFYVYYTTHGTYSFTSHPKDEAIMVKCLAQGHKCRYRESNPHSGFLTTPELVSGALDR